MNDGGLVENGMYGCEVVPCPIAEVADSAAVVFGMSISSGFVHGG